MQVRIANAQRSEDTRAALVAAARALFVKRGYAATSTPEVVAAAGLSRGALYHHFADKEALFRAVIEAEAQAVAREIEQSSPSDTEPLDALRQGAKAYYSAMNDPERTRLILIDGPAGLGPATMRAIDLDTGGRELRVGLAEALGCVVDIPEVEARADLISAMFERAALANAGGAESHIYEDILDELIVSIVTRPA